MANVTETSAFDAGIYQLETTDQVEGGAGGISNAQAKGLANRTRWLYDRIADIFKLTPKRRGVIFSIDPGFNGALGTSLVVSGDITSAVYQPATNKNKSTILVTIPEMASTNYKVRIDFETAGDPEIDSRVFGTVFKKISKTQFRIYLAESFGGDQQLNGYIEVISLD